MIAAKIGCASETLRKWGALAEVGGGQRPDTTTAEAAEL